MIRITVELTLVAGHTALIAKSTAIQYSVPHLQISPSRPPMALFARARPQPSFRANSPEQALTQISPPFSRNFATFSGICMFIPVTSELATMIANSTSDLVPVDSCYSQPTEKVGTPLLSQDHRDTLTFYNCYPFGSVSFY